MNWKLSICCGGREIGDLLLLIMLCRRGMILGLNLVNLVNLGTGVIEQT